MAIKTPVAILSYPCLFKPEAYEEGDKPAYSCALIFTPEAQQDPLFKAMKEAARDVAVERWGDEAKEVIQNMRYPLFRDDGDEKGYPDGSLYINVRATNVKPTVVSNIPDPTTGKVTRITEQQAAELGGMLEVYPGALVQATVGPFHYNRKGNKGVSFGLNNLMVIYVKPDDRVRLAGGLPAEEEFEADEEAAAALADLTTEFDPEAAEAEGDDEPDEPEEEKPKAKAKAKKPKKEKKAKPKAKVDLGDLFD